MFWVDFPKNTYTYSFLKVVVNGGHLNLEISASSDGKSLDPITGTGLLQDRCYALSKGILDAFL